MTDVPPRRQKKQNLISRSFTYSNLSGDPVLAAPKKPGFVRTTQIHKLEDGSQRSRRSIKAGKSKDVDLHSVITDEPSPFTDTYLDIGGLGNASGQEEDERCEENRIVERTKELSAWLENRHEYLDELMRHDGRGGLTELKCCVDVKLGEDEMGEDEMYRCLDCLGMRACCKACILRAHSDSPLHRIQRWLGYWARSSLEQLGLVIQLGHPHDRQCQLPMPDVQPLVVVHTNGIHNVQHRFCGCEYQFPKRYQLMRERWFPATQSRPRTVFTFDVLDFFLEISYQGKTNAHDFCASIANLTDGCGLNVPKRYDEFLRVSRQYAHLHLLKRGGRGNVEKGIMSTGQGELAIECPACPHPGKNLLDDWRDIDDDERWLYALHLAIDANFRLKLKDRSVTDPEFGPGWAYFVNNEKYTAEIAKHPQPAEKSDCTSTHQAIERATSKMNEGYSVTGIGAVICSRHGFVRPNGVGDLQHGERYANMDYIFLASILGLAVSFMSISYDIACQWSRNLKSRVEKFPSDMQASFLGAIIQFFVPKFHLPTHGEKCQGPYSLNWSRGMGRTDGEGIERGWALVNLLATMLREMGPGFRHDTFDNHWSALNWRKLTGLGKSFKVKLKNAVKNAIKHSRKHLKRTEALSDATLSAWTTQVASWHANPFDTPSPFLEPPATQSVADVRRRLTAEEETYDWSVDGLELDSSPSAFIIAGIELEDQITKFADSEKPNESSMSKVSNWHNRRNAIHHKCLAWLEIQTLYMPAVASYTTNPRGSKPSARLDLDDSVIKIWLPSALRPADRAQLLADECSVGRLLISAENSLRLAQLEDSLDSMKRLLRSKVSTKDFTRQNIRGQKSNTRARNALSQLDRRINERAARYRRACNALLALDPEGAWSSTYLQLLPADVVMPLRESGRGEESGCESDAEDTTASRRVSGARKRKRIGEGYRTESWIWQTKRSPCDETANEADDDILRVMWTRGKARAERWTEEVALLLEEMRRTLAYCEWKVQWWQERTTSRSGLADLLDGTSAYAVKQVEMWKSIGASFAEEWAPLIHQHNLPSDWPSSFCDRTADNVGLRSAVGRRWFARVRTALGVDTSPAAAAFVGGLDSDYSSDSD